MARKLHDEAPMRRRDALQIRLEFGTRNQFETRLRRGARQRVGGERVSVQKKLLALLGQKAVVDSRRDGGDGERQKAAGQRLRETDDIGFQGGLVGGEKAAAPAEE